MPPAFMYPLCAYGAEKEVLRCREEPIGRAIGTAEGLYDALMAIPGIAPAYMGVCPPICPPICIGIWPPYCEPYDPYEDGYDPDIPDPDIPYPLDEALGMAMDMGDGPIPALGNPTIEL